MDSTFRQIVRHASVFGLGAILSRLASIVLLPLYTRYLHTADYGVIAIVDLTVNLLGIAGSAGVASAATREHFQHDAPEHIAGVWWTALAMVGTIATAIIVPTFVARDMVAGIAFGDSLRNGGFYFALALPTLWVGIMINVLESYFRAQKASTLLVTIGLGRLLLNVTLNVVLLVRFDMGITAVLWGNLLTGVATVLVELAIFYGERRQLRFNRGLVQPYWRFGWPLMVFGFLSMMMHEADRYILSGFSNLEQVGLYSVAYQIGQGTNAMIIMPFLTIWGALVYEVARQPGRELVYARVFKHFAIGLALLLMLASLFAGPILQLISPPEYAPARRIVPIVCLAYLFFSLHEHFRVPALIANRTVAMLPVVALSVAANVLLNLLLIPRFGAMGAAWASVATFIVFSGAGLVRYRRIERYPYPFGAIGSALGGMIATYAIFEVVVVARISSVPLQMSIAALIWMAWAGATFGGILRELLRNGSWRAVIYASPSPAPTPAAPPGARAESSGVIAGLNEP